MRELTKLEHHYISMHLDHSMNIGTFPALVEELKQPFDRLYRGIRCLRRHVATGQTINHWEPLLSCTLSRKMAEEFATRSYVPEDVISDEAKRLGGVNAHWDEAFHSFIPVVLIMEKAEGLRITDVARDHVYEEEEEVVVPATPLLVTSVDFSKPIATATVKAVR